MRLLVRVVLPIVMLLLTSHAHAARTRYVMGEEFHLIPDWLSSTDKDAVNPAVAYINAVGAEHDGFVCVWRQGGDEFNIHQAGCQMNMEGGNISAWQWLSPPFPSSRQPDVAYDFINEIYVIVYSIYNSDIGRWEIHSYALGAEDAMPVVQEQVVLTNPNWDYENPFIAFGYDTVSDPFNPRAEFLVAAQTTNPQTGESGALVWTPLDSTGSPLHEGAYGSFTGKMADPQVGFLEFTQEYVMAWTSEDAGGDKNIIAARINMEGVSTTYTIVAASGHKEQHPSLTAAGNRVLILWEYDFWGTGADWDIHGAVFDSTLSGATYIYPAATSAGEVNPEAAFRPSVGSDDEFVLVWQVENPAGDQIAYRRLPNDNVLKPTLTLTEGSTNAHRTPAVAAHADGFLFVYASREDDSDPYGMRGKFLTIETIDASKIIGGISATLLE